MSAVCFASNRRRRSGGGSHSPSPPARSPARRASPPGRVAALLGRQRREEVCAARSDRPDQRRRSCASRGAGRRCRRNSSPRIPNCVSRTIIDRRRSWWAACCMPPTPSVWSRRSIRRPAGRSGRSSRAGEESGNPGLGGALRAVAFWGEGAEARVFSYHRQYLYALNPKTGAPIAGFGAGGRVDLGRAQSEQPVPVECAAARRPRPGARRPVDAGSGFGEQGGGRGRRGARIRRPHGPAAVALPRDSERRRSRRRRRGRAMRCATSAPATSGRRWPPTRSSGTSTCRRRARPTTCTAVTGRATISTRAASCASTLTTGRRVWHFQTVHHDLFDYDNPASPIPGRHHGRRPAGSRRRPGDEAGLRLRARPRDRRAGVADRGAAGSARRPCRARRRRRRSRFRPNRRRSIDRASRSTT